MGPAGVAVHVVVGAPLTGLHWLMVEMAAALAGAPVMLLVMVDVHVNVLAPPPAEPLHCSMPVIGRTEVLEISTPLTEVTITEAVVELPSAL